MIFYHDTLKCCLNKISEQKPEDKLCGNYVINHPSFEFDWFLQWNKIEHRLLFLEQESEAKPFNFVR